MTRNTQNEKEKMKMKKKLITGLVMSLLLLGVLSIAINIAPVKASSCVLAPSGLVSWWPGDGDATDIADGNSGVLQGGAGFASGKVGEAFSFDGVDDYVSIADNTNLHVQELTIDAWIYLSGTPTASQYIIRKWLTSDGGYGSFAMFRLTDNKVGFTVQSLSPSMYPSWTTSSALSTSTWHHVAFTWKAGSYTVADGAVYVDGAPVAVTFTANGYTSGFSIQYSNLPLYFARKLPTTAFATQYYYGMLDEVEVFNRVLSSDEVLSIYSSDVSGKCKLTVSIDVKPGSFPNSVNLGDQGLLPVAILGSATLDVTHIDPSTIVIGGVNLATRGSAKAPKLAYSIADVNGDGVPDMMLFFSIPTLVDAGVLTQSTPALTVTGNLLSAYDGTGFFGTDSVNIVPP
jgi:hypothetical protein